MAKYRTGGRPVKKLEWQFVINHSQGILGPPARQEKRRKDPKCWVMELKNY